MSLEAALKENTATMRELIEVLTRTVLPQALPAAETKPPVTAAEVKALMAEPDEVEAKPAKQAKAAKPKAAAVEETPAPKAAKIEYAQVSEAISVAVAKFQRGPVVALLGEFGAANGKQLKPEDYAAFLDGIAKLEAEEELA